MAILKYVLVLTALCGGFSVDVYAARPRKKSDNKSVPSKRPVGIESEQKTPDVAAPTEEVAATIETPIKKTPVTKATAKKVPAKKATPTRKATLGRKQAPKRAVFKKSVLTGQYGVLQNKLFAKAISPQPRADAAVRIASGMVPLGLAGAGVHQFISGNRKTGAALLAGATGAAIARAVLLQKRLKVAAEKFDSSLKDFIEQWPAKKETVPVPVRQPLETMYQHYKEFNGPANGAELVAFAYSLDAWRVLERVRSVAPLTEVQKCKFVESALGDLGSLRLGPRFYIARMVSDAFQLTYLDMPFTQMPAFAAYAFPLFFHGPLRRYAFGVKEVVGQLRAASFDDVDTQYKVDSVDIRTEWPFKVLEPPLHWFRTEFVPYERKQIPRFAIAAGASVLMVLVIKAVAGLLVTPFARKEIYNAHLLKLDTFLSTWPAIKVQVPAVLQERFDELYDNKFDTKAGRLRITNEERATILKQVSSDIRECYKAHAPVRLAQKPGAKV